MRLFKWLFVLGVILFSLRLIWLFYQESFFWPRGSWTQTPATPEYVHERFQRSYFSATDAEKLRRLHNSEAFALIGIVVSVVAAAALKRKLF